MTTMGAWIRRPVGQVVAFLIVLALTGILFAVLTQGVGPLTGSMPGQIPNCGVPDQYGRMPEGGPSLCHP